MCVLAVPNTLCVDLRFLELFSVFKAIRRRPVAALCSEPEAGFHPGESLHQGVHSCDNFSDCLFVLLYLKSVFPFPTMLLIAAEASSSLQSRKVNRPMLRSIRLSAS